MFMLHRCRLNLMSRFFFVLCIALILSGFTAETGYAQAPDPVISGVVFFYPSHVMMEGVTMEFENLGETKTNSGGYYEMAVPYGWSGTLRPVLEGYAFEDSVFTYVQVTEDTGTQDFWEINDPHVMISGKVTIKGNEAPLSGVTVSFSNGGGETVTDENGEYGHILPYKWSGTAEFSKAGYVFDHPSIAYEPVIHYLYDQNAQVEDGPDFTITGRLSFYPGDEPIEDCRVYYGDEGLYAESNSTGEYEVTVPFLWEGEVRPVKEGYAFQPSFRPFAEVLSNKTEVDFFVEGAPFLDINGRITWRSSGYGENGVIVYYGNPSDSVLTDSLGQYSITVPFAWSGEFRPVKDDLLFDPDVLRYTSLTDDLEDQDIAISGPAQIMINGKILDKSDNGVAGIPLYFNEAADSVVSDENGDYSILVPNQWSGTVRPSTREYIFHTISRTYAELDTHQFNQNYQILGPANIQISGRVADEDLNGIEGVAIQYGDNDFVFTNVGGYYAFTVPFDWSGTVNAGKECYDFTPEYIAYENLRDHQTDQDYTVFGTPTAYIRGRAHYPAGGGLEGAAMLIGADSDTVWTLADGSYEAAVPVGWTGLITPVKDDLLFDPPHLSYTSVEKHYDDANYTVLGPAVVTISGKLYFQPGKEPISSTAVYFNSDSVITDSLGAYQFQVENDWSGTVVPAKNGYDFNPSSRLLENIQDHLPLQDFWIDGTPLITVSGSVKETDDTPVPHAVIKYAEEDSVLTDTDGNYSFSVEYCWSGAVHAYKDDLLFLPDNREYSELKADLPDQNYTVLGPTEVIISGNIQFYPDEEPVGGTKVRYSDDAYVMTDSSGAYQLIVDNGWTGVVRPEREGYIFQPAFRPYTNISQHHLNENYLVEGTPAVNISGTIRHHKYNNGIEGVKVVYGAADTVLTDENGEYNIVLNHGWSGAVKPVLEDMLFEPRETVYSAVPVNQDEQNYTLLGPALINIEGRIVDQKGNSVGNVILETGLDENGQTDDEGYYKIIVENGWSGEIIPGKEDWLFDPPSFVFTAVDTHNTGMDFLALGSASLLISGKIEDAEGEPYVNTLVLYGDKHDTTFTDSTGFYRFIVENGWNGTVTPVKNGSIFSPYKRLYENVFENQYEQNYTGVDSTDQNALVIATRPDSLISRLLVEIGLYHSFASDLPEDLSGYDLIISKECSLFTLQNQSDIESYVFEGGSIILLGNMPALLCGNGGGSADIAAWFGAGQFDIITNSTASILTDNPLGAPLYSGDILAQCQEDSALSILNLGPNAAALGRWERSAEDIHSFISTYENGKTGYIAYMDNEHSGGHVLFKAMCEWAMQASTSVEEFDDQMVLPTAYSFMPAYPNPFNPGTTLSWVLPENAHVTIDIFDINGRKVKTLVNQKYHAGTHSIQWNADDEHGRIVSSGLYICRLRAGAKMMRQKLIFTK